MHSKTFPPEMRALARALPLFLDDEGGNPLLVVSGRALHRALGVRIDLCAWAGAWADEWRAYASAGRIKDSAPPLRSKVNNDILIRAELALWMALNACTETADDVTAYLRHAERRHRIRTGGLLAAIEIAEEYRLTHRRKNCTRRIGDAILAFIARSGHMPPMGDIGTGGDRVRGFPVRAVEAWHRYGGGADLIARERRSPRPEPRPRVNRHTCTPDPYDYDPDMVSERPF